MMLEEKWFAWFDLKKKRKKEHEASIISQLTPSASWASADEIRLDYKRRPSQKASTRLSAGRPVTDPRQLRANLDIKKKS
eukprot:1157738-Pelagomonas_calceolata.AAC.6